MAIEHFQGQARFLSNFWLAPVSMGGIVYPSAEHAYQAHKSEAFHVRQALAEIPSAGQVKRAGQKIDMRPDWNEVRKRVMLLVVLAKFTQHQDLAKLLADTGEEHLVEGNRWHDNYWGSCECPACALGYEDMRWADRGFNHLGKTLMAVRNVVRAD